MATRSVFANVFALEPLDLGCGLAGLLADLIDRLRSR